MARLTTLLFCEDLDREIVCCGSSAPESTLPGPSRVDKVKGRESGWTMRTEQCLDKIYCSDALKL